MNSGLWSESAPLMVSNDSTMYMNHQENSGSRVPGKSEPTSMTDARIRELEEALRQAKQELTDTQAALASTQNQLSDARDQLLNEANEMDVATLRNKLNEVEADRRSLNQRVNAMSVSAKNLVGYTEKLKLRWKEAMDFAEEARADAKKWETLARQNDSLLKQYKEQLAILQNSREHFQQQQHLQQLQRQHLQRQQSHQQQLQQQLQEQQRPSSPHLSVTKVSVGVETRCIATCDTHCQTDDPMILNNSAQTDLILAGLDDAEAARVLMTQVAAVQKLICKMKDDTEATASSPVATSTPSSHALTGSQCASQSVSEPTTQNVIDPSPNMFKLLPLTNLDITQTFGGGPVSQSHPPSMPQPPMLAPLTAPRPYGDLLEKGMSDGLEEGLVEEQRLLMNAATGVSRRSSVSSDTAQAHSRKRPAPESKQSGQNKAPRPPHVTSQSEASTSKRPKIVVPNAPTEEEKQNELEATSDPYVRPEALRPPPKQEARRLSHDGVSRISSDSRPPATVIDDDDLFGSEEGALSESKDNLDDVADALVQGLSAPRGRSAKDAPKRPYKRREKKTKDTGKTNS
eukprot:Blabericola_migrator_1__7433@NODE_378_length_9209_cov_129_909101_g302_i0_p1_GENE_NODE_378_length_9209_cov_129_909101_g302_i0NODE_378_length_9209_cov_129_909101_g302_i0_p1_ORF_typecomplete_len573_score82_98DUF745/PF05335_13/0_008DUF745/PF05335_13/1_5e03Tropomyosin_1/PF12718_7/0_15Tropomyosin_1/PF12718_7/0_97DUF5386/PF17360_2/4_2e02DUF5386/PF17360_2/1e04DUF5386/PF17360_2/0_071TT_ORF1/PF02956_14/5_1e03TT_ORF1/PF02956_14/0_0072DUF3584/PF12128_8/0_2AAA_13/PF13166_6/0_56JnkSapK_ap_N/PF09744_9/1_6JnkSa